MTIYQYGANNPILYIDVNGDSLAVTGEQTAIDKFTEIANTGLGANYNVKIVNGVVSVVATGKEEDMTDEQKAFLEVMNGITTSEGVASVELVESSENVLIGSFDLESVDVNDIAQFPTTGPSTASGTLSHELVEQSSKQLDGNGYPIAHYVKGLGTEDKVNCSMRGSTQSTTRTTQNSKGQISGNVDIRYFKNGTTSTVSVQLTNNNVTKVEIK
jgi:hypothetical protein